MMPKTTARLELLSGPLAKRMPMTVAELARHLKIEQVSAEHFLRHIEMIPWVIVLRDGGGQISVEVDHELRGICELLRRRPTLPSGSWMQHLRHVRSEITRRRKENHDERLKHNWNPEAIVSRFQSELLNWIEEQLDVITMGNHRIAVKKPHSAHAEKKEHHVQKDHG